MPDRTTKDFQVLDAAIAVETEVLILAVDDRSRDNVPLILVSRAFNGTPIQVEQVAKVLDIEEQHRAMLWQEPRQFLLDSQVNNG